MGGRLSCAVGHDDRRVSHDPCRAWCCSDSARRQWRGGKRASSDANRFGRAYDLGPQRVSCLFGREWPVSGIPLSKASCRDVGGGCTSWLSVSSAVKSITDNIPERHIFSARNADECRSKSKDRFSTMMNELC